MLYVPIFLLFVGYVLATFSDYQIIKSVSVILLIVLFWVVNEVKGSWKLFASKFFGMWDWKIDLLWYFLLVVVFTIEFYWVDKRLNLVVTTVPFS